MSYAPILLSDSISLAAGATGNFSTRDLTHPFRQAMWLDSISWILRSPPVAVADTEAHQMGGSIRCKLEMGSVGLTRFFVPVWCFGPLLDQRLDTTANSVSYGTEASVGAAFETGSKLSSYSQYLWKLPKPLLIPSGACLVPVMSRTADGFTGNAQVDIAYSCREIPQGTRLPKRVDVPYVTPWIGAEGTAAQISGSQDLENETHSPFFAQRLVGRIQARVANSQLKDATNVSLKDTARTVQLRMKKGADNWDITSGYYPWAAVFDWQRRACNLNRTLDPGDRIIISVANIAATETPMVAMVGYREETVQ